MSACAHAAKQCLVGAKSAVGSVLGLTWCRGGEALALPVCCAIGTRGVACHEL